jgi:excisionase family DNA binding protein
MHRLKKVPTTESLFETILNKISTIEKLLQGGLVIDSKKKLLTAAELAKYLKVSDGTIYNWINQKRIPFIKVGSTVRFDQHKIDMWLQQRSVRMKVGNMTL